MEVIDSKTAWEDRAFYFSGQLDSPVVAKIWRFRSENEYDSVERPEVMAMTLIRSFAECIGKRPILLVASDIGSTTVLRSKKGVLWDHKELRQLPHIAFEIECGHGETRLGAVVDLTDFSFDSSASALLNWGRGLVVLTTEPLDDVKRLVEQWTSKDTGDVLAFDYDAIAASLQQNTTCGILRYLPPGNSRPETIVVVGEEHLVSEGACECIDSLT
ncbi:MAG: hypothetical protein ACYC0X_07775 [Pirellulaceae bacterium]